MFRYGYRSLSEEDQGLLLDRIDIHVEVPRVDYEKLADKRQVEDSKTICARVQAARGRQLERFKGTKMTCNAEMGPTEVRQFYQTDALCGKATEGGNATVVFVGKGVSRVTEESEDDCGPGGERDDCGESHGGGDSVLAQGGDIVFARIPNNEPHPFPYANR